MYSVIEDIVTKYNKIMENGFTPKYIVMDRTDYVRLYKELYNRFEGEHMSLLNSILDISIVLVPYKTDIIIITDAKLEYMYKVRE